MSAACTSCLSCSYMFARPMPLEPCTCRWSPSDTVSGRATDYKGAPTPTATTMPVRGLIEPTSEARYRIQLNASESLKDKLELLQALTSHSNASGDLAVLSERAVDLALEEAQRKRFAKTGAPRTRGPRRLLKGMRSRLRRGHIANATKREVAERDGVRCTYVSEGGHRCTARAFLQIHHQEAWARGGRDSPDNLQVMCGRHNRLLGERDFGAAHVAARIAERTASRSADARLLETRENVRIRTAPASKALRSRAASGKERTI